MKLKNLAYAIVTLVLASYNWLPSYIYAQQPEDVIIINQLADQIDSSINNLFENAKKELDRLFNKALENIESSDKTAKNFQSWLNYLSEEVIDTYEQNSQKVINNFTHTARNLPLVEILEENNIYLTEEVNNLGESLNIYKETLKDKLFSITDDYIDKVDLREMAYQEIMGKLGAISWNEKLKDLSEEKQSTWESVKDFASSVTKSFIAKAKPEAEKQLKEAGNKILEKTGETVKEKASSLGKSTLDNIKGKLFKG